MPHDPDPHDPTTLVNHGILPNASHRPGDLLGAELPYEVIVLDGNHTPWVPTNEPQSVPFVAGTERFNCVTQAHHNAIENQMNRDIAMGRMPVVHRFWLQDHGYMDANNSVNFSERFSSIRNGTMWNNPDPSKNGNWVVKVTEDGYLNGLIPASMLPDIPSMPNVQYYDPTVITQEMINLGREFKQYFSLPYGWVGTTRADIVFHMKQAPLMVTRPGHEIVGIRDKTSLILSINDSYDPFIKDLQYTRVADVMKTLVQYIIKKEGVIMVFHKIKGTAAIWQLTNGVWVGFADQGAFDRYTAGHTFVVLEIDQVEFNKIPKSTEVIKT